MTLSVRRSDFHTSTVGVDWSTDRYKFSVNTHCVFVWIDDAVHHFSGSCLLLLWPHAFFIASWSLYTFYKSSGDEDLSSSDAPVAADMAMVVSCARKASSCHVVRWSNSSCYLSLLGHVGCERWKCWREGGLCRSKYNRVASFINHLFRCREERWCWRRHRPYPCCGFTHRYDQPSCADTNPSHPARGNAWRGPCHTGHLRWLIVRAFWSHCSSSADS